ncbi:MAG: nickel-dependent lactate racemase [Methanomassiliicoccales archaeon]
MRLEIPYGREEKQEVEIPDRNLAGVIYPNEVESGETMQEIRRGIEEPIDSPSLQEFLRGQGSLVFIINDGTRPTPTAKVMEALSTMMNLSFPRYLVATGAHREPTEEEYLFVLGGLREQLRPRVHPHDCRKDRTVYLGKSKNGTEMWINEMAVDADRLVIITSVEPHYFAGYTGGRKSILPGVAAFKTIEQNHRLAMRPQAQSLALEGNPVHEDMMEALEHFRDRPIFSIQVVMDRYHNVYRVASGDLVSAFHQAVEWANEVFSVGIEEKVDAVISVAPYPMDVDLYQSQKAIDNAKWALKEGGRVILVSKCREGVGPDTFLRQLSQSDDPREVLENLSKEYRLGYHKAAKMAEVAVQADLCAVTGLEGELLEKANIHSHDSLQQAVDSVLEWKEDARILVLMDGSVTVPRVD